MPNECIMCHCNVCRYTTGSLGVSYLALSGPPSEKSLTSTTAYKSSEKYTRYFCQKCGCNVFVRSERDGRWLACPGILERSEDDKDESSQMKCPNNITKVICHWYLDDAKDGGIAPFLTKLSGRDVPCYRTEPDAEDEDRLEESDLLRLQMTSLAQQPSALERGQMLEVSCHCGECQLLIAPPAYTATSEGWYVPKTDRSKYYARFCCCRSCRLTLGFTLQPWAYIPPSQFFTLEKEPVVFGPKTKETVQIDKLKHYQSSEFVIRSFCSVCGATVFYQSFERPYIIDLSVGVVRSKMGNAMAGEWLEWDREIVSKRAEAVDEELVEAWLKK
ncbi:uncharacterized protein Z520_04252 [Fonsecaea multimorphosa CBS 102226]|uniref:CENP-V/GFA domain-containing protein n=1 Tax=Fonsecaea multimorphosa CBS 102226 TaxID=1442371 RepID=A0A0D2K8U2_9EURO|nr:uncharacterized protein Z520_04252 [Fonsecaea multimorphosa CBS 102226]KIX99619.1 hypothetical protein Z520_04252 [Fonsecaea multimorphosa CBS 102226]OAL26673.1 hypothetical protein AYO22_04026 [Fonsecaea multimorphosa]